MKKHSTKSMNTLCVFTGYEYENASEELVVKFSQGILEDAWMGNYESLSDDFVREFRRIDRHGRKGENLMTVLRRDMRAKDPPCLSSSEIYLGRVKVPDNIFKLEVQLLPDAFQGGPVLEVGDLSYMVALQP